MIPRPRAAIATDLASVPTVSREGARGCTPASGTSPMPGFSPTTPQAEAGIRTDPPVSVPSARSQRPAATATAEPEEDPPGQRCTALSHGFQGAPTARLVPHAP